MNKVIIIREFRTRLIVLIPMVIFLLVFGYWLINSINEVTIIGNNAYNFDVVFKNWDGRLSIKKFHESIKKMKDSYLLVECGTTNGTSLDYYLINLDKKQIEADFFGKKGIFLIKDEFIKEVENHINNLKYENQIYDATSGNLDDGAYFLTYYNKNHHIKFGFYSYSGNYGQYSNKQIERITALNRSIYYDIVDLIEREIYRQKPQVFMEQHFFSDYFI